MTKNNSINKLDRNYDQTNAILLSNQRKRRSKSQVTSNKTQEASIKNGIKPRISTRRKKLCEPSKLPASTGNPQTVINLSSTETTTDSTSTICKEKFLDKLDLHVKPKVKISKFFTCDFCDEDFLTQNYLNLHVLRAHKAIITCKQTSKSRSNLNKTKSTLREVHRYVSLRQRYETTNTQLSKFNTRFVSKVSEERKRRRKLFREHIQVNKSQNKSTDSSTKMSEVEDKSNLQVPTSTVEIDESSKDNTADSPTSTSDVNEYKSEKSPTATIPPRPEKPKTYNRKKSPKANKKNTKDHGYCDSCTRSFAKLDTHYQSDIYGTRKIKCEFCSNKFVSVNGLFRHVALYHLNCTCIRNKCHWYDPFTADINQLSSAAVSKNYRCNYCSKDYDDYKKYNFHYYSFHELEPVSDELVEKTPKYLKDIDNNVIIKSWVPSACKTNFFGKKLNSGECDEDYDNTDFDTGDFLPLVCQKCGEFYFNNKDYMIHLDNCYYQLDLAPVTPLTEYPKESRAVEELRESSLKPESNQNRRVDVAVKPNIKLQFFPQDIKAKPRNPRKLDANYELLRRTCRRCNKAFATVKELSIHYQDIHGNSANNNNNNANNKNNNAGAKAKGDEKDDPASYITKTKKDYDDENNITYYNYKNTPWYGHNVRHKWQCVHCKLSFKIFRAFSNHLFFEHNDESLIHICENCHEILTNLDQINKHLCVNVTSWTCKLCDLKFQSGFEFRNHNTQKHYELFEPSVCLACGKKFLTHYMLMRHVKNKKCSSEKAIDELINTYTKKSKKNDSLAPQKTPPEKKKGNKKDDDDDDDCIIILDETGDKVESSEIENNAEDVADVVFELVDCSADNFASELESDVDSRKTDVLATASVAEEKTDVVSDKIEETKKQVPDTERESVKESIEETTNDDDTVAEEEGFDDASMDDDSPIEDTNDEDSDDGSEDDDDEEDEDLDDEDLDDEELDDEEFDDDESVDVQDSDDLKKSENNYNELVKINDDCSKIVDFNEDTYDELEGIKNYVLENEKNLPDSASNKRKITDESLTNKRKKLLDIHDTFVAQADQLNDKGKIKIKESVNRSAKTSRKPPGQVNRCSMCKLQFSSMTLLSNHFNRSHTSAVEVCQLCYKMYITGNLVKHMVKDHFRSDTDLADALVSTKDEISIERDTRDFISIVGKVHLLALCKYQEPPQASSEESVDCSDCSLTFKNSDKYRIHNVEVHDKFCALCIVKFRSGQEAAKHKLDVHGSTACYVWFASKMINAIGDTDTFKEAVGLKAKKRKPKNSDQGNSHKNKNRSVSNSRNININVRSNINIDDKVNLNMIDNMSVKQESMTLKDKILDILRKSQPTLDRLNSQIQTTRTQPDDKQINKPQTVRQCGKESHSEEALNNILNVEKPQMMIKTPVRTDKSTKLNIIPPKIDSHQSPAVNQVTIKNKKVESSIANQVYEASDDQSIIITCGLLKKDDGQDGSYDSNEDEKQFLIVVKRNDLEKYRNNLHELAAQFVASTNMSTEEMVRLLKAELDNI
ncbi:GSCOCG00003670001-RA-CDS [Cotesia congregata]|nr:GSCOCG00003670001-RA-CDS [Cotesia congregata]